MRQRGHSTHLRRAANPATYKRAMPRFPPQLMQVSPSPSKTLSAVIHRRWGHHPVPASGASARKKPIAVETRAESLSVVWSAPSCATVTECQEFLSSGQTSIPGVIADHSPLINCDGSVSKTEGSALTKGAVRYFLACPVRDSKYVEASLS